MKRAKSFSDLLLPIDAWPKRGYNIFAPGRDRRKLAEFGGEPRSWFAALSSGYKKAADLLVEEADGSRNFIVYPIIFCYRHFVELSIKGLLAQYRQPMWNCHDLMNLWTTFLRVRDEYVVEGGQERDPIDQNARTAATEYIQQLSNFDPTSVVSRYHVNTTGRSLSIKHKYIDLHHLEQGMDDLEAYFRVLTEVGP